MKNPSKYPFIKIDNKKYTLLCLKLNYFIFLRGVGESTEEVYWWRGSVDVDTEQVSDVSDICFVVEGIMMRALHGNEQLPYGLGSQLARLALRQRQHSALHEVELLLEVVEANTCVDFVPI